jgi:hypothetical protein
MIVPRFATLAVFVLASSVVATGNAQPLVTSFDQVRLVIKAGDRIAIRDVSGARTSGAVVAVSPSSIRLAAKGATRDFSASDVVRIQRKRRDSLWNGAAPGAIIGIVSGGAASQGGKGFGVLVGLAWGGTVAAIGAGVDALIVRTDTIYERSQT